MFRVGKFLLAAILGVSLVAGMIPANALAEEKIYEPVDKAGYTGEKLTKEFLVDLSDGTASFKVSDFTNPNDYIWVLPGGGELTRLPKDAFNGFDSPNPIEYKEISYNLYSSMIYLPFILMNQNALYMHGGTASPLYKDNKPVAEKVTHEWPGSSVGYGSIQHGDEVGAAYTAGKKMVSVRGFLDVKKINVIIGSQTIEVDPIKESLPMNPAHCDRYEYTVDESLLNHDDMVYDLNSNAAHSPLNGMGSAKMYDGYGFVRIKFKKNLFVTSNIKDAGKVTLTDAANPDSKDVAFDKKYQYKKNSTFTLTATPTEGYQFVRWVNNGNVLGTDKTLSVEKIMTDMNIVAEFKKIESSVQSDTTNPAVAPQNNSSKPSSQTSSTTKSVVAAAAKRGVLPATGDASMTSAAVLSSFAMVMLVGVYISKKLLTQ